MSRLKKALLKKAETKKISDVAKHIEEAAKSLSMASNIWENLSETEEIIANEAYSKTKIELSLDDLTNELFKLSDEL